MRKGSDLDQTDLNILRALQDQGRITNQDLAERVCLSPSSCLNRVRRLEEDGFIVSYHARLALKKLTSSITCFMSLRFKDHSTEIFKQFDAAISELPEVLECYSISGEFDYLLKVITRDMDEYVRFSESLADRISTAVTMNTHVVMSTNKESVGVPLSRLVVRHKV